MTTIKMYFIFTAIIMVMTTFAIMKALYIAYKRQEITKKKFIAYALLAIVLSLIITGGIMIGFEQLVDVFVLGKSHSLVT